VVHNNTFKNIYIYNLSNKNLGQKKLKTKKKHNMAKKNMAFKIHAVIVKTKTQTIAKMKYLVHESPQKKQKFKLTLIQQHCNKKI